MQNNTGMKFNMFSEEHAKRRRPRNPEKERRMPMLRGMEKLISMEGFIRDAIEEGMEAILPYKVKDMVFRYADTEKGFWDVVEATERAFIEMKDYERNEDGEPIMMWDEDFEEWYIGQTARVVAQRVKTGEACFWNDWTLSRDARFALQKMLPLDEYILFLSCGLDGSKNRDAKEIAALPEFEGSEAFIETMFERLEKYLETSERVKEEFGQACEIHRTVKE